MNRPTAFLLLSFLHLREAQTAALKEFYYTEKQSSRISTSTQLFPTPSSYSRQSLPSVSSSSFVSRTITSSCITTETSIPASAWPTPLSLSGAEDSEAEASSGASGLVVQRRDPLGRRQDGNEDSEAIGVPAWITSPEWALYSFSASLFPPPTAVVSVLSEATAEPSTQSGIFSDSSQASNSDQPTVTSLPSSTDASTAAFTLASSASSESTTMVISSTPSATPTTSSAIPTSLAQVPSTVASTPPSLQAQEQPTQQHSNTTAIVVGVVVPVVILTVLVALIFLFLRRRRQRANGTDSQRSLTGKFASSGGSTRRSALPAGISVGFKKLQSSARGKSSGTPSPDFLSEKSPASSDPPPFLKRHTAILSKPGRLPSPSRRPKVQGHRRVNSATASLTDGTGDDTRGLDFHCGGESPRTSGDTARFVSSLPTASPTVGAAFANPVGPHLSKHRRQGTNSSWLSTSSADTTNSLPAPWPRPPLPTSSRRSRAPSAHRAAVYDDVGVAIGSPTSAAQQWWSPNRSGSRFDSYHPGIDARDFALGNYSTVPERRVSDVRSSISLSSGPWSDSDEEETVEVPLTVGSDVQVDVSTAESR